MGKTKVSDFFLYRYRYFVGYALLACLVIGLLFVVGVLSPGGISVNEQQSAVASESLSPLTAITKDQSQIINAPYHLLQKVSFDLLGVSALSIKLPSLILGGLAICALHGLLRLWFRRNVALITSIIAVSTGLFLFTTQSGTPAITYFFWNVSLLWTVSMLTRGRGTSSLWLIVAAVIAAYSLYLPLQVYIVAGLFITCLIHPHARFVVFRRPLWALICGGLAFLVLAAPLVVSAVLNPSILPTLLGIPQGGALLSAARFDLLGKEYAGFMHPLSTSFIAPAYGLGVVLLALIGVYRLFTAKYTAKSYILTTWLIFIVPIILFVPSASAFTLLPIVLLIAFAIDYLIRSWYRLFPFNPYARVIGLLPLAVLVIGVSVPCIERMVYGYHYSPQASSAFTQDLALLKDKQGILLVPESQKAFYETYVVHDHSSPMKVTSSLAEAQALKASQPTMKVIADRSFKLLIPAVPADVIVSTASENANRFYLYTNLSM